MGNNKAYKKPNSSALTIALQKGNQELINLVLSAEGLQLDVDYLKSKNVFAEAVTACQEFVVEKMGGDGINDKEMIILFALDHDMDKFAKILVKDLIDSNGEEKIEEEKSSEDDVEGDNDDRTSFSKKDNNQNSAIMICLKKKKMEFVDLLLSLPKTNVNVEDTNGDNAALFALKNDMKDCLKKILERKDLSINHKNKEGQSLLSIAMEKQELDVIETILENPDVDLDYVEERLLFSIDNEMDEVAEIIAQDLAAKEKTKFARLDSDGNNSLMLSLKKKKMNLVDAILSSPETNVNIEDSNGDNAALWALKNDMKDCLNVILARGGLNINHKNKDGQCLLTISMTKHDYDIAKILIQKPGINLDVVDENGISFPFILLHSENLELIQEIVEKKCKIDWNAKDAAGDTVILSAFKHDLINIFKILSAASNIDFEALDTNGQSVEDLARNSKKNRRYLDHIPGTTEFRLRVAEKRLEEMNREECPVCLNVFTSSMKIQQCTQGHFTCEPCRNKIECCSECREPFMGRAFGYERILRNNDYNKQQCSEDPVMVKLK